MTYLPGGRINATISGNTAGAGALVSSGTLTLAGGNNITLSQAGNAITISGGAAGGGSQTLGMSNLGNTSGTTGVVSGSAVRYLFAGGNNVTLSQSINGASGTVTISAASQSVQTQSLVQAIYDGAASITTGTVRFSNANGIGFGINGQTLTASHNGLTTQTVQTQNVHNVTLSGNTAGAMAHISSGTLTLAGGNNITLSQNGNAVTISGAAGGAGGGIALANSETTYTSGTANLVASGALTIGSTTGQSFNLSVPQTSSLSASGGVMLSTNGSTISLGVAPSSVWMHNSAAVYSSSTSAMVNTSVSLVRMVLPYHVSFSRVDIPVSVSGATSATANTAAMAISAVGVIYSRNAATLNPIVGQSSTTTYSYASNTGVYASVTGPRLMSFNLATSLSAGEYYMGVQFSSRTSSVGTATTNLGWTIAPIFGTSYTAVPWQEMSAATNQTINVIQPLQGMNSVSISNTTQTHQQSQITQSGATAIRANLVVVLRNI